MTAPTDEEIAAIAQHIEHSIDAAADRLLARIEARYPVAETARHPVESEGEDR